MSISVWIGAQASYIQLLPSPATFGKQFQATTSDRTTSLVPPEQLLHKLSFIIAMDRKCECMQCYLCTFSRALCTKALTATYIQIYTFIWMKQQLKINIFRSARSYSFHHCFCHVSRSLYPQAITFKFSDWEHVLSVTKKTFSWPCNSSYPCPFNLDWAGEGNLCCTLHNDVSYLGYRPPTLIQFCFLEEQRLPLLIHHLLLLSIQDKEGNWSETWRLISNEFQDTSHNPSSSTCAKCSGIAPFRDIGDSASHDRDIHHRSQTIVTCFKYFIITSFLHQPNRDNLINQRQWKYCFFNLQILNQRYSGMVHLCAMNGH